MLKELPLSKCIAAWGLSPPELQQPQQQGQGQQGGGAQALQQQRPGGQTQPDDAAAAGGDSAVPAAAAAVGGAGTTACWRTARLPNGKTVSIPRVPAKYLKFLRVRQRGRESSDAAVALPPFASP
jgi:hypothetical protein